MGKLERILMLIGIGVAVGDGDGEGVGVVVEVGVSVGVGVDVPNSKAEGESEQASMESIKEPANMIVEAVCFLFMISPMPFVLPCAAFIEPYTSKVHPNIQPATCCQVSVGAREDMNFLLKEQSSL
jgi:hypothetical protein